MIWVGLACGAFLLAAVADVAERWMERRAKRREWQAMLSLYGTKGRRP